MTPMKCRDPECSDPMAEGQRIKGLCKTCYQRAYMRVRRASHETDVIAHIDRLNKEQGDASTFACYWCDLYDDRTNAAVAWFMDEAACQDHLDLAKRWATFALRKDV